MNFFLSCFQAIGVPKRGGKDTKICVMQFTSPKLLFPNQENAIQAKRANILLDYKDTLFFFSYLFWDARKWFLAGTT